LGIHTGDTQNTRDLGTGVPKTRGYPNHCDSLAFASCPGFEEMHECPTSRDNFLIKVRSIMAAAVFRFDMLFYGVVLVILVLCNSGKS